ncbi:MAG TPA: HAMP domain-containing sensor histidine kinase [Verrucomicrobiae bacterium]|jgi:heavy metal sensor kinase|nr:HAMP domain-containing sensor histidine kinase [Verrucomicrobiae bacterium]
MNTRSVRFRLTAWYAGLLAAVFVLFSVSTYQLLQHYLQHSLADLLLRRTDQIAVSLLANAEKTGDAYVADEIKARYAPENYDRFIRVTRGDGGVIYASGRAADFDPTGLPPSDHTRVARLADGSKLLVAARTYQSPGGRSYILESGGPMQPIEITLRRLLLLLVLGVPLVAGIAILGGYFLLRRALGPVVRIAQSAEQITLHNLNERLPLTDTGDELEQLSLALNRMIDRLREAFEQNRRFLADASHELRTPLTALRGELESVLPDAQPAPVRDRIGSALEEVDRLAKIVETLFAISRLEAGEAQREWARFDLAQLATGTAEQMALLADDKGVAVECDAAPGVNVEGDQARIKQVVVNLLDNAIKYTPAGGSIRLRVHALGQKAVMEVIDTGIGIPATALPHVFERFFRVDEARSRQVDGAGLGLAIVKSICAAHGGLVEVDSAEQRGSRFRVELPLAQKV